MIFVERKCSILTFKVGYTFLQDTLYIGDLFFPLTCRFLYTFPRNFAQISKKDPSNSAKISLSIALLIFRNNISFYRDKSAMHYVGQCLETLKVFSLRLYVA